MNETINLTLLGKPQIFLGQRPVMELGTAKAEALLYYLAVTGRPHSREVLVDLLWGDMPEAKAKRNLTTTLSALRKVMGAYLIVEPQNVAFNVEAPHQVDVTIFQAAIEGSAALEPADLERDLAPLRLAVNLYSGDFLEGFYIKNALAFEEWTLQQRERLRELMVQALQRLIDQYLKQPEGEQAMALEYATRLLALDPWREAAHRQMMILLARNGQRSAALAQYETCRRILAEELGVEPTAETTALYERLKKTQQPVSHDLPSQPNTFVGRVREINQLTTNLNNPDCRLLTLVGPGGIGKTRLAIEGGRRFLKSDQTLEGSTFIDGIYFVNLAPITLTGITNGETSRLSQISSLVASAIADTLGFSFHGPTDLMVQLLNYLGQKELLLILDNFEHLVEGAGILADLLQRAPQIKLLVTSRERLNLMEEWVMEVEGLEFPTALPLEEVGLEWAAELEGYSAVALFVRQAQQVRGDFTLSEGEVPHVVRICQLVQGIPLALVLAASWLRVLSCAEIVQEIEQSLDFLSASLRNLPERHHSLRAVFEQSWQMLSDPEKRAFKRLSLFWAGFRREAAGEVAGASLSTLTGLVDKSLLRLTSTGRYEIHELLRQFAAEKLAKDPAEQEATREAYRGYFAGFMQAREWQLVGRRGIAVLAEMSEEGDNIRACWHHTMTSEWPVTESEIIQGAWSLIFLYTWRGWYQEGIEAFGQVIAQFEEDEASAPFSPEKKLAYGKVLLGQGNSYHLLGNLQRATELYQQSLLALRQAEVGSLSPIRDQALALHLLGVAAWQQGRYTEAEKFLNKGLTSFKEVEDQIFEARSTLFLGIVAHELGEYVKAEQLLQEGLLVFKDLGEYWYATEALVQLARLRHMLSKSLTEIQHLAQENLRLSRETGSAAVIVEALNVLGTVLNLMGGKERVEAKQLLQESVALCRELNDPSGMAHALHQLALASTALGDYQTALACFHEALEISTSSQFTPLILEILVGLAMLWFKQQAFSPERQEIVPTLATLVFNHPASNRQTQDRAAQLLAELEEIDLSPEIVMTAKERGQAITLQVMAQEILSESNENV